MGFFEWIREGVKRAVLMGFSDAVTHVGNRKADEDLNPQLAMALQQGATALDVEESKPAKVGNVAPGRKRLGRSLDQLREPANKNS